MKYAEKAVLYAIKLDRHWDNEDGERAGATRLLTVLLESDPQAPHKVHEEQHELFCHRPTQLFGGGGLHVVAHPGGRAHRGSCGVVVGWRQRPTQKAEKSGLANASAAVIVRWRGRSRFGFRASAEGLAKKTHGTRSGPWFSGRHALDGKRWVTKFAALSLHASLMASLIKRRTDGRETAPALGFSETKATL